MRKCIQCNKDFSNDRLFCESGHVLHDDGVKDPLVGRVLGQRYRVGVPLGEGGFGLVYVAADLNLNGMPVVVKIARPEVVSAPGFRERFLREKFVMTRLSGEYTAGIRDFGETEDGLFFLVLEFLHGRNLRDEIAAAGPLQVERVVWIARGIAMALAEAHGQAIVHRDIKPANVMIVQIGEVQKVKVIDFGVAGFFEGAQGERITKSREVLGTLVYASPEQCLGRKDQIDHRADLYGLGAVMYEMLTGFHPYRDIVQPENYDTYASYLMAHVIAKKQRDPTPLSEIIKPPGRVPQALADLVMRLLSRSPERRPASAQEVLNTLDGLMKKPVVSPPSKGRLLWPWIAALVGALIGMAGFWQWLARAPGESAVPASLSQPFAEEVQDISVPTEDPSSISVEDTPAPEVPLTATKNILPPEVRDDPQKPVSGKAPRPASSQPTRRTILPQSSPAPAEAPELPAHKRWKFK